ncbi:MAG: alpha/beta hydrolase [Acidimicrobiia bacterium]|nr:alpha/beta hydrolase [Acidimicrobiia bacterium]
MGHDTDPTPIELHTADGLVLEGELADPGDAVAAVLLAHPHPAQGGSMRSLVTSELFGSLPGHDLAVLRFNFRSVGSSEGTHGGGEPERVDIVAGLDSLAAAVPDRPLVVAGWSFGADVSLAVTDERLAGWCAIAPPLRILDEDLFLAAHDQRPKLLVVPEHDQFNPPDHCRAKIEGWTATTMEVISGGDHFLVGRTAKVAKLVAEFAGELATAPKTNG